MRMRFFFVIVILLVAILLVAWILLRPGAAPWTESGTLTLLVDAVPEPGAADSVLDVGIRSVRLHRSAGGTEALTLGATRISLDPHHSSPQTLTALNVPAGEYIAISFEMRSPALKNNWQEDAAPDALTLAHEEVHLPIRLAVLEGEETVVHARFETARAIRIDETGEYTLPVYLPALTLDVWQGARVAPSEHGLPVITGGSLKKSTFYGQQWDGTMREHKRAKDRLAPEAPELFMPSLAAPEQSDTSLPNEASATSTATATSSDEAATTTEVEKATTTHQGGESV